MHRLTFLFFTTYFILNSYGQKPRLLMPVAATDKVERALISPGQRYLIGTSYDPPEVKVWDFRSKKLIYSIKDVYVGRYSIFIDPTGTKLLTKKGTRIDVWDIEEGNHLFKIENELSIDVVTYSPDGGYIAAAGSGVIKLWDSKKGSFLCELKSRAASVYPLKISPDGNFIAVCNNDTVTVWDVQKRQIHDQYQAATKWRKTPFGNGIEQNRPKEIEFSGDGELLVTLYYDSTLYIRNLRLLKKVPFAEKAGSFSLSKAGQKLALLANKKLLVFDSALNKPVMEYPLIDFISPSVSFSCNGDFCLLSQTSTKGKDSTYIISVLNKKVQGSIPIGSDITLKSVFDRTDSFVLYKHPVKGIGIQRFRDGYLHEIVSQYYWKSQNIQYLLSSDPSKLLCLSDTVVQVMDLKKALIVHRYSVAGGFLSKQNAVEVRNSDDFNENAEVPDTIIIKNSLTGEPLRCLFVKNCKGKVFLNSEGNYLLADGGLMKNKMLLLDVTTGRIVKILRKANGNLIEKAWFMIPAGFIATTDQILPREIKIFNIKTGQAFSLTGNFGSNDWDISNSIRDVKISPDGRYIVTVFEKKLIVFDLKTNRKAKEIIIENSRLAISTFSKDGHWLAYTTEEGEIVIMNATSFMVIRKWKAHLLHIYSAVFTDDASQILTASYDGTCKLSEIATGKILLTMKLKAGSYLTDVDFVNQRLFFSDGSVFDIYSMQLNKSLMSIACVGEQEFIFSDKDNYYLASPAISKKLAWRLNKTIFSFNQFDIRFNRPDKILQEIGDLFGNPDTSLIFSYKKAYEKRMAKLKVNPLTFSDDYNIPEIVIQNRDSINYEQSSPELQLHLSARDSVHKPERLHIRINEVPIYGKSGLRVSNKDFKGFDSLLTITLSQGSNLIEVSLTNNNGIESYRVTLNVNYTPLSRKKEYVYFIGIGIDQFKNPGHNLQWCAKDIRDLVLKLKEKYGPGIFIDTLFDEAVTLKNIKRLKQKLMTTDINDKVIIAYSGHGLLSKEYDYYLSSYDINFQVPSENGIPYEVLEDLLDSIPARKKLLLLDACHSGEVDKDEVATAENIQGIGVTKGLVVHRGSQEVDDGGPTVGLQNSFDLMQSLFVNVGRNTGATAIAAAAGVQFAQERGDLQNGVFTYCILELLQQRQSIRVSELNQLVGVRVLQLTNGLQKPTTRSELKEVDWEVW